MVSYERLDIFRLALDQAYNAVVITTAELDRPGPAFVYVNQAFCSMTGYSPDEVIGATPRILQGPKTDPELLKRLRRTLEEGEIFQGSTVNYRKNGTPYLVEWNITPVRDEGGTWNGSSPYSATSPPAPRPRNSIRHCSTAWARACSASTPRGSLPS